MGPPVPRHLCRVTIKRGTRGRSSTSTAVSRVPPPAGVPVDVMLSGRGCRVPCPRSAAERSVQRCDQCRGGKHRDSGDRPSAREGGPGRHGAHPAAAPNEKPRVPQRRGAWAAPTPAGGAELGDWSHPRCFRVIWRPFDYNQRRGRAAQGRRAPKPPSGDAPSCYARLAGMPAKYLGSHVRSSRADRGLGTTSAEPGLLRRGGHFGPYVFSKLAQRALPPSFHGPALAPATPRETGPLLTDALGPACPRAKARPSAAPASARSAPRPRPHGLAEGRRPAPPAPRGPRSGRRTPRERNARPRKPPVTALGRRNARPRSRVSTRLVPGPEAFLLGRTLVAGRLRSSTR